MLYELILINEIEQRAKIIFLSVGAGSLLMHQEKCLCAHAHAHSVSQVSLVTAPVCDKSNLRAHQRYVFPLITVITFYLVIILNGNVSLRMLSY